MVRLIDKIVIGLISLGGLCAISSEVNYFVDKNNASRYFTPLVQRYSQVCDELSRLAYSRDQLLSPTFATETRELAAEKSHLEEDSSTLENYNAYQKAQGIASHNLWNNRGMAAVPLGIGALLGAFFPARRRIEP
jgi:hypothetical protein